MTKNGIEMISEERKRQIEVEGWTAEHDAQHSAGEMAVAAACYALHPRLFRIKNGPEKITLTRSQLWPWSKEWWKPDVNNRIRELVKAGALIAAEIDRLNAKAKDDADKQNLVLCSNCESEFDADQQGHEWTGDESNHGLFGIDDEAFTKLAVSWAGLGLGFCCMECEVNYYRGSK